MTNFQYFGDPKWIKYQRLHTTDEILIKAHNLIKEISDKFEIQL